VAGSLANGFAGSFSEGAAYDSQNGGYGQYESTSQGYGLGSSLTGIEFGAYTGSMSGATKTYTLNTPLGSLSVITDKPVTSFSSFLNGEKGLSVVISKPSWPKWGFTETDDWTRFIDLDWKELMYETYDSYELDCD